MSAAMRCTAAIIAAMCVGVGCTGCSVANNPVTETGFAMDTAVSVTVYGDGGAASDALAAITALENEISWSIDGSAVNKLNSTGGCDSATLGDIVNKTSALTSDTGGEFSLLTRPLCALWNVTADAPKVPGTDEIAVALAHCSGVPTVSGEHIAVPDGAGLDLGAVGKGAACDSVAALLGSRGISSIAAVGGSLALIGSKPDGSDWKITVSSPDDINTPVGTLSLDGGQFVSTSGDGERYFIADGKRYSHIISAVTGYPADSGLRSVTVVCGSGLMSDALSTACFLVGYSRSLALLEKYGAQAVFILTDGDIRVTDGLSDAFEAAK